MKVLHIESGLGNQMLDYCDLLAERQANPDEKIFIENMIYSINGACQTICQWNGYELERVFGITERNISELFSTEQWERIVKDVNRSHFWEDNWRYSDAITEALAKEGLILNNIHSRPHEADKHQRSGHFAKTRLGYAIKRKIFKFLEDRIVRENNLFIKSSADDYTGHTLQFCYKKRGIERIDKDIRAVFTFPEIEDKSNKKAEYDIASTNSVAIHVRRGDMLSANSHYYKYGYFKRAVTFIKRQIDHPIFYFFCDPDSKMWVQNNLAVFGLKPDIDRFLFVSGNNGLNSYKDMQLMSKCKHAVITNSSFGFWGAYLIQNKDKITCSPDVRINTTHNF